ncbi:MAG: hypothetical protein JWO30_3097 [Fibrobacteres bacterium]|nr:hypothetical protein [Fibrobacterota bacterium]
MHESLLNGQVHLLEMLVLGEPLEQILDSCLRLCEANSDEMLCSILILDPDGIHLRHGAAPSLPPEFMRLIDGRPIGPSAGSCGTAAFLKEPVIVEDIATDPLWSEYRDFTLPFGLRACWSTPIFDRKRQVLGTFAIYYRKPCRPTPEHLNLIGIVTNIAGIAIHCRRAEEKKRQVFERISDAFVALDTEWRFTYVNSKAGGFIGHDPASLIGKNIWSAFPDRVGQKFHLAFEKAMAEQIPIVLEDFYPPTGKWFENRVYPSPQGLSVYFLDVTERKRIEEKIRQSEKMTAIGQLASGIAHDFNNQLSVMLGYAGLLESRLTDPELKRFSAAIVRAADRSGDLTRNLLAFTRQGHHENVAIDIHELIGEVIELLGHSIDRRITLETNLRAPNALVMGDPATLQNALLNLALNARDAMPEGGVMGFATEALEIPGSPGAKGGDRAGQAEFSDLPPGSYLHLSVTDTGTGMSDEVKRRAFEPFFTTKPVGKGTGMGLASVFGTVNAHKGGVAVESVSGHGTRFRVYLPLTGREAEANPPPAAQTGSPQGLRVLIVEDEGPIRDLIGDMLRAGGHSVIGASGGHEALVIYRERWREIDLIILDMVMADIDGFRTFRELRRINPEAKVIISSGYSPEGEIQTLLDEGAKGLLQKPYGKSQLDKVIAGVMD